MLVPRHRLILLLALLVAGHAGTAAQAPRISKPRPAPPGPSTMAPLPPAIIDDKLAIGGQDVKARRVETRLSVDVRINGHGPYHFLVDSGADTSVVGLHIARELQLPLGSPVILNGMTERSLVDRVKIDSLDLGPTAVQDLQLPALDEGDVGGEGMIGIDALVRQRIMLDFEKRLIKVEDATKPAKALPDEIVIVARRSRGQLILTHVRADSLSLDAVIDTGAEMTIGNPILRERLLRRHQKIETVKAIGVTGKEIALDVAVIPELRIGGIILRNLPVAFADLPPFHIFGIAEEPALFLGSDVLEQFRKVSLDFQARKVRFQLKRCSPDGFMIQTFPSFGNTRLASVGNDVCAQ
jgi:predicted aspartyl protease